MIQVKGENEKTKRGEGERQRGGGERSFEHETLYHVLTTSHSPPFTPPPPFFFLKYRPQKAVSSFSVAGLGISLHGKATGNNKLEKTF